MSVATKKGFLKRTAPDEATAKAMVDADLFLSSNRERKAAEAIYVAAKAALLDYLGPEPFRLLPDGRTVFKSCVEFPQATIERKAYTATTVTVGHSPVSGGS